VATGASGAPALFLVGADSAYEITEVSGPTGARMFYADDGNRVYISNGYWKGLYEQAFGLSDWGLDIPGSPTLSLTVGDLPPGIYKVCYTNYVLPDRLGGNGAIAQIEIGVGTQGIKLHSQPSGTLAWITQPNGSEFYLAQVEGDTISKPFYTTPLMTLGTIPPEPMTAMVMAHGRLFGARGKNVLYSEEFMYENFRLGNRIPFPEEIVMIADIASGLFVSSLSSTWIVKGTTPAKFQVELVGDGAIPGTLTYALVEGTGYEISKRLSQTPSPMWATKKGFVVGTQTGHIVHLTEASLKINPLTRGAAVHYLKDGEIPQTLFSLYGVSQAGHDATLHDYFERGRIYIPSPAQVDTYGGIIVTGEIT